MGAVWDEHSFVSDYGVQIDHTGTPFDMLDGDEEARLDRELDGDGSDSDSSLDLHTPLPYVTHLPLLEEQLLICAHRQLMVKDGLLSPNSKLIQASRNNTPLPGERPGSVFSVVSAGGSPVCPYVSTRVSFVSRSRFSWICDDEEWAVQGRAGYDQAPRAAS